MKKALKIVVFGALGVTGLVLIGALFVYLTVDLDALLNAQIAKLKPEIEKSLGPNRHVEIGPAEATLLPILGARITEVKISGNTSNPLDSEPLFHAKAMGFGVGLWDAILSLGKRIHVSEVYLDGAEVRLLRFKDGSFSVQDILDHMNKEKSPDEEASIPAEILEYIRNTSVGEVRLGKAHLALVDFATPSGKIAESHVRSLNMVVRDLKLSDPIYLHIDAAIESEKKNFDFDVVGGPLPQDLKFVGMPNIQSIKIDMQDVDVSRFAPYFANALPVSIDAGLLSAHFDLDPFELDKPLPIKGFIALSKTRLGGGQGFDFRMDSDLTYDAKKISADISRFEVKLGSVKASMTGKFETLSTTPKFKSLKLQSTTLDVSKLVAYYPPLGRKLPSGMKAEGPISLNVIADGDVNRQTGRVEVDATQVDLLYPDTLIKPKGIPLTLHMAGILSAGGLSLSKADLVLDALNLHAEGDVKNFANPNVDASANSNTFDFDRLARLIPSLRKGLESSGGKASGSGKFEAKVKGTRENLIANLDLALKGIHLSVPDTELHGDATLHASAQGNPEARMKVLCDMDASAATIKIKDTLNKASGVPMLVALDAEKSANELNVRRFALRLAELNLGAQGSLNTVTKMTSLVVNFDKLDLEKFSQTLIALPKQYAKDSFVDMKLGIKGDPSSLNTLVLHVEDLNAQIGKSDMKGSMTVQSLETPTVVMSIKSNVLDVDQLMGLSGAPADNSKSSQDKPELKKYKIDAVVDAQLIQVKGNEMRDFKSTLKLRDGVLYIENARFDMFGGHFSASGSKAEIWKAKMPYDVKFDANGVDINQVLSAKSKYAGLLFGKSDLDMSVTGEGFELPDLEKSLTGRMDFALKDGQYKGIDVTDKVASQFSSLKKVPGMAFAMPKADGLLKDLQAKFKIEDGKLNLRKPMQLSSGGATMFLDGAIGIGGKLALEGNYMVNDKFLGALTGGKCKTGGDLAVPLKVGGTFGRPSFEPDARKAAQSVLGQCAKGQAGKLAGQLIGKDLNLDTAKQDLQKKADEEKQKLEARANEEKARLQAQAEEEKRKLEARAKEEADKQKKNALDKVKKRFGF